LLVDGLFVYEMITTELLSKKRNEVPMERIGVIGGGTMGTHRSRVRPIGYAVTLVDVKQDFIDRALATIKTNLERQAKKGIIAVNEVAAILGRITTSTEVKAVANCELVVEAATEDATLKKKIFAELDVLCPAETILASNTSSISITEIAAATKRPEKVIGMHFSIRCR
jgi:3-hydroxybutyryl-CoA dehydrogenase